MKGHPQSAPKKATDRERIIALERLMTAQSALIEELGAQGGQQSRALLATRGVLFAVARVSGIKRDDLHAECTKFADAIMRGSPQHPTIAAEYASELNRVLGEYEAAASAEGTR